MHCCINYNYNQKIDVEHQNKSHLTVDNVDKKTQHIDSSGIDSIDCRSFNMGNV